jgi:thiol-disulfide isomerase/thioredoxin
MKRLVTRLGLLVVTMALTGAAACGSTSPKAEVPSGARTVSLSIHGMDCEEDPPVVMAELQKEKGVYDVKFDRKTVVMHVVVDPTVTEERLVAAVARTSYRAEVSGKGGSWAAAPKFPEGADIVFVVKDGSDVPDLASVAVAGKFTVVDLYADWCKPCRQVDEHMMRVLAARGDVAYRKLNIVDWDTPLARHHMNGIPELPYVVVFGANRQKIDAISGLHLDRLDAALAKGAGK